MKSAVLPARQAIAAFLERLDVQGDFPAFAEHVSRIASMSKDVDASIRVLTDVILDDVALTAKVLRTANSVLYNRTGDQVIDVSYAVLMMGFERVRDLALSAKLFDHLKRKGPGFRQLMVMSLLTANQSQRLARVVGYPATEEAYLCGMFHSLGEIIAACYAPEEYGQISSLMTEPGATVSEASRQVFGFTFDALGVSVAALLGLPPRIISTMRPATEAGSPFKPSRAGPNLLSRMISLADQLTLVCYRADPAGLAAGLARLHEEYGRELGLSAEVIQEIVDGAFEETRATLAAHGVAAGDLQFQSQAAGVAKLVGPDGQPKTGSRDGPLEPLVAMIRRLKQHEQSGDSVDAAELIQGSLEAVCSAGWERSAFALASGDRTEMRVRMSHGEGNKELAEQFTVALTTVSPLQTALLKHRDLVLGRDGSGLIRGDAVLRRLRPASFAVLPLVVGDVLVGCLYCDHRRDRIDADHRLGELLMSLRDSLARLFRQKGIEGNA